MTNATLHHDIKHIDLFVRKLMLSGLAGNYLSALKGSGLQFEEVRQYQPGDEVRSINWNITAKTGVPYVKIFREERELQLMIVVDRSASTAFGTQRQSKADLITHMASLFALLAAKNNDRAGLMTFSNGMDTFIPCKKGQSHAYRIIETLLNAAPAHGHTPLTDMFEAVQRRIKKRSVVVLISDFFDKDYEKKLQILARKHDVIPMMIHDRRESVWENMGVLQLEDLETGKRVWVDSDQSDFKNYWKAIYDEHDLRTTNMFKRLRLDVLRFQTGEPILKPLMLYFKKRTARRAN